MLFRKGVKVEGFPEPGKENNVPVKSELCRVVKQGGGGGGGGGGGTAEGKSYMKLN